jgi:nucleotide-binding universal stress UspA family protein
MAPSHRTEETVKHLLIATDGSSRAKAAAEFVASLFAPGSLDQITVLAVLDDAVFADASGNELPGMGEIPIPYESWELINGTADHIAHEAIEELCQELAGLGARMHTLVRSGVPWNEIVRAADELDVTLIVLGTHGGGLLRAILHSSASEHVLHHTHRPVLIVPTPVPNQPSTGESVSSPTASHS